MRKLPSCLWILCGVLVVGGVFWTSLQAVRSFSANYDEQPTSETFSQYFGKVPAGVSDLRASGYSNTGGAQVWMRFQVTSSVLPFLTQGYEKLTRIESLETAKSLLEKNSIFTPLVGPYDLPEEHRVHWEGIRRIKAPEVYKKPQKFGGSDDLVVVDRDRLLVYFFHWNQ